MLCEDAATRYSLIILIAALLAPWNAVFAQEDAQIDTAYEPRPFSTLEIKVALGRNLGNDNLFELWQTDATGAIEFATPFYEGYITAGVQLEPFSNAVSTLPSFWSLYGRMGWHLRWSGAGEVTYDSGARLGLFFMAFDGDASAGVSNESELAYSLYQVIHIPISGTVRLMIEGAYSKVFTRQRMSFYHLSAGVIVPIGMPSWLQSVLQ